MGIQKNIAKTILKNHGDYILALKENHKTLYNDAALFFKDMESMTSDGFTFDEYTTFDEYHG